MPASNIAELMTSEPVCVFAEDPVSDVYTIMTEQDIRHVPVVDHDGRVEGIITQRDLMKHVLFAFDDMTVMEKKANLTDIYARSIMTPDPETITTDILISEAARMLIDNKIGCLPVTDGRKIIGIVTESDFVKQAIADSRES